MSINPQIPSLDTTSTQVCIKCGRPRGLRQFAPSRGFAAVNGKLPICNYCIDSFLKSQGYSWDAIDKICQYSDTPFIVKEWTRLAEKNEPATVWPIYVQMFQSAAYEGFGWADYNKQYNELRAAGLVTDEIPLVDEEKYRLLKRKWGINYSNEELDYLEDLYQGLSTTHSIVGALQIDQAQKICKLSLEIDQRIQHGDKDVEKFLSSYDKLVKTGDFTPKSAKNAVDFDSFAEVGMWLEKRGHINKFYDGATRDVIDETLKNIESYNQRLYINEGTIGEEIKERMDALKTVDMQQDIYKLGTLTEEDEYANTGFVGLDELEDFNADGDKD